MEIILKCIKGSETARVDDLTIRDVRATRLWALLPTGVSLGSSVGQWRSFLERERIVRISYAFTLSACVLLRIRSLKEKESMAGKSCVVFNSLFFWSK
jgi:hypothetical protein